MNSLLYSIVLFCVISSISCSTSFEDLSLSQLVVNTLAGDVSPACAEKLMSCAKEVAKKFEGAPVDDKNTCCALWSMQDCVEGKCTAVEFDVYKKAYEEELKKMGHILNCINYPHGSPKCK